MTRSLPNLSPRDAHARIESGRAILVDIREPDEFARSHVPGARSLPLSRLGAEPMPGAPGQEVIFTCRSGMRTAGACDRLGGLVPEGAYILEGGLDAWAKAGFPVQTDARAPIEVMRQVQIVAGALILIGVALGFLVSQAWFALAGLVGAGLAFAGVSGSCMMASLLMHMPWNRRPAAG